MTGSDVAVGVWFVGLLLGVVIGAVIFDTGYKAEAIQRGYASYCPTDGNWAWKGECGE